MFSGGSWQGGAFGTVMGACEINAVFTALDLTTLCACAVRAMIDAIFGDDDTASAELYVRRRVRSERQLRRFLDRRLAATQNGKLVYDLIRRETPALTQAVMDDDEVFGLSVRVLEPWLRKRTVYDLLETKVDAETAANLNKLAKRVARVSPKLKRKALAGAKLLEGAEGRTVRQLMGRKTRR